MRCVPLTFALLVLLLGAALGDEDPPPLTDEDRADLAFFASLEFPDVTGKPFVAVRAARMDGRGVLRVENERGFLLEQREDGSFDVFTTRLRVESWTRSPPGTPPQRRIDYRVLDFEREIRTLLDAMATLRGRGEDPKRALWENSGGYLTERTTLLALAAACAQRGRPTEAHALMETARGMHATLVGQKEGGPLRHDLYDEFATPQIKRLVLALGDPRVPRRESLGRFQGFLKHFPKSERLRPTAEEAVRILKVMVAEDEAHAQATKPFEPMTKQEQIAELIFQLRDQHGGQWSDPGSPSIWHAPPDAPRNEETPAHKLEAMGYAAVPQLIDALTDRRFTRTLGWWRSFVYSHYVVRIGHAASEILTKIAGEPVGIGVLAATLGPDHRIEAEMQQRARAWWAQHPENPDRQPDDAPR